MELEKRKRLDDGNRVKAGEDDRRKAETEDDEVEEFFAILRRIHVAVQYFEKGNGEGRRNLTAKRSRLWSPSFEPEDFGEVNGVEGREGGEENVGLDLNADPEVEPNSV